MNTFSTTDKPFLTVLSGQALSPPPIWLMRQAGRYLPEYKVLRARAKGFLDFCFQPELAVEATLQPIRRFGLDAAILFSDILTVPWALGQKVDFLEGEGPRLEPLRSADDIGRLNSAGVIERLSPVYRTVAGVAGALPRHTALIGFAGAPWTIAAYMVEGHGSRDFLIAKAFGMARSDLFDTILDIVTAATIEHLSAQVAAGAEAVQLFDSWAGVLAEREFRRWVIAPTRRIAEALRTRHPEIPLIGFPRGAGGLLPDYANQTGVGAVGLDTQVPLGWALNALPPTLPVQGNLDPVALVTGGHALRDGVRTILDHAKGRPLIFNLGHGVPQTTPPDHVAELVRLVRGGMTRRAVVLFNLGGPDSLESVRPFLFNLFNDKAIFRLPQPFRALLAAFVAKRRAPTAIEIYRHLGGGSPLLPNTEDQARALHSALGGGSDTRIFIAMRYWHPFTIQTLTEVQKWGPDEIILLPLYPQYSTTTSASSLAAWYEAARFLRLKIPTKSICCYPTAPGFIDAMAERITPALAEAGQHGTPRLLFSAHGLPEAVVEGGDPYQFQVERTAAAIVERLGISDLDWLVCYQSRVGPLKWIGPSTDEAIRKSAEDKVPIVVAPIAFVSEHSETLVEIEIEYRKLALTAGVPYFVRVPTVGAAPSFIAALVGLVNRATAVPDSACIQGEGRRICPSSRTGCPIR